MDRDLLSAVLGRRIWPRSLAPARLRGYRRKSVRGASYPVVLQQRRVSVEGVILDGVDVAEKARLSAYEGDGYELVTAQTELPRRRLRRVFLFTPKCGAYNSSSRPWSFAGWRLRHKRLTMKAVVVGWVEQNAQPARNCRTGELMGFAALNPSYRGSGERTGR